MALKPCRILSQSTVSMTQCAPTVGRRALGSFCVQIPDARIGVAAWLDMLGTGD